MRKLHTFILMLISMAFAMAQTVTVSPTTVVITNTSPSGNVIKPLESCYFVYKSTDSTFQVYDERNVRIFNSDCDDLTTESGDNTTALKVARIAKYCLPVRIKPAWYYYFPKGGELTYTATNEKVRLNKNKLDFTFQIDSITAGTNDTTTALKLTWLKNNFNRTPNLQIFSAGGAATVAADTAAGTTPTISVSGNAVSGTVTLTTGTTAKTGKLAVVTLPVSFPNGTRVLLTPADSDAATVAAKIWVTSGTSTFTMWVATAALSDATQYLWNYTVTGH